MRNIWEDARTLPIQTGADIVGGFDVGFDKAIPEETKDKEYSDLVKWVWSNRQKKGKEITSYSIFTTTDCNARCYYCFEMGRSRMPMNQETALKVVQFRIIR